MTDVALQRMPYRYVCAFMAGLAAAAGYSSMCYLDELTACVATWAARWDN